MGFLRRLLENLSKLEPLTVMMLTDGLRMSCGLIAMAILFVIMLGHFGDYMTLYSCIKGAYSAAFGVLAATVIASLLGDLYVKEKKRA